MPLARFVQAATVELEPHRFVPLDVRAGRVGGDRHGTWDWTWVRPRLGVGTCLVSVLADREGDTRYSVEVHAGAARNGAYGDVLVDALLADRAEDEDAPWWATALSAIHEAALRAFEFPDALMTGRRPVPIASDDSTRDSVAEAIAAYVLESADFPPFTELLGPVVEVFSEIEHHETLSNRDVLVALIKRGIRADRSGVNAALSELAASGRVIRVRKGLYTRGDH